MKSLMIILICLILGTISINLSVAGDLHEAISKGEINRVEVLIEKGSDVNAKDEKGAYPLNYAAAYNRVDMIHLLLERGAEISAQSAVGDTALHCATRYGGGEIATIKPLLDAGVSKELKNAEGKTALDYAKDKNQQEAVKLLHSQ
ncbi:ankyrin repeat protein, putative [Shewanella sediminis HAW-EB3]|uniref:Ankyrin repeat protein, putative n=1 Tax=Shewanella sediminis (strain HAW-EB3) TaxID=425104 RepID=A8G0Z0_SHESH|nr:ankyrin repeat domain-containing protein [Shewanella sediminis]ABV38763.1 ankyrin repeat protein, putative [Shewanella sediminis HAW-EB3]